MAEFKKGDRVIVEGLPSNQFRTSDQRNGTGIIEDEMDSAGFLGVELDTGNYVAAKPENVSFYVEIKMQVTPTPPQKIQQNGYEYELVGPVKPDWLVDGAWIVRKDNGCKHQVKLNSNGLLVLTLESSKTTILLNHHIYDQYRPHTPEDFKWGDWAIYEGNRVFVMGSLIENEYIEISKPPIHNKVLDGWDFIHASKLTPTF